MRGYESSPGSLGAPEQQGSWAEGIRRGKTFFLTILLTSPPVAGQLQKPWASCQALFLAHASTLAWGFLLLCAKQLRRQSRWETVLKHTGEGCVEAEP